MQRRLDAEREARELRQWRQMRAIDIDVQLTRLPGRKDVDFRGMQREGLEAVVEGRPYMLVVMRTGAGKGLLFMVPAVASTDGVAIVIVPMTSIRQD